MPTPRLQTADLITTCVQTQYGAAPEHPVRAFRPSAVTAATFTDVNLDATCNGLIVIAADGPNKGIPRFIRSVAGGVATYDTPHIGSAVGTTAIMAFLAADVVVRVTTADAAGPFDVISSPHAAIANEPNDFWAKYWLIGMSGANLGMAKEVTTFVAASGTFTAGANAATALGDWFILRRVVRSAEPVMATLEQKSEARSIIGTGDVGGDMPMTLGTAGTVPIVLEQRPLVTSAAAAAQAAVPQELGDVLRDHFNQTRDTSGAITAIDDNSITTSNGVFSANGFALLANGKLVHVLSVGSAGAVITKYGTGQAGTAGQAAAQVPVASVAIASTHYNRKTGTEARFHRLWQLWRGGLLMQAYYGSMPTLSISINREQTVRFTLSYPSSEPFQYDIARPVSLSAAFPLGIPDFGVPIDGKASRFVLDGISVTIDSFDVNTGLTPNFRPCISGMNQYDGMWMQIERPTGTFKVYADQNDIPTMKAIQERERSGAICHALYQKGHAGGHAFGWASPTLSLIGANYNPADGQGVFDVPFQCTSPLVAVDALNAPLYPVATFPGLKEMSFGWA